MLPIDTCLVSTKFYKSPLTNYDFGVAIGALLLKLENFKKVKLIFGHPVFHGFHVQITVISYTGHALSIQSFMRMNPIPMRMNHALTSCR